MAIVGRRGPEAVARAQVREYRRWLGCYGEYAETLKLVLSHAARKLAPLAIIEARPKSLASLAEKIRRPGKEYRDPLREMTDLCGARVIATTKQDVEAVCRFVEASFAVDRENSVDIRQRLTPAEFGYRSVHYVVQFRHGAFPCRDVPVRIPRRLFPRPGNPMKAEIQVRTLLEHAWAVFTHDRSYKCGFRLPERLERELAGLAAMLEETDNAFDRILQALREYEASYRQTLPTQDARDEIRRLQSMLRTTPDDAGLAYRIGRLAIQVEDWDRAIALLSRHQKQGRPPLIRDLGFALCQKHQPGSAGFRKGQDLLAEATRLDPQDNDATCSLAGSWKKIAALPATPRAEAKRAEGRARNLYRRAFRSAPTDPYPLGNYLEYEIAGLGDTRAIALLEPVLKSAVERSRKQARVGVNLPWAYFDMGKLMLLLGRPCDSLAAYARAIDASPAAWMLDTSLRSLDRLGSACKDLAGCSWARTLLLLGMAVGFPRSRQGRRAYEQLRMLATSGFRLEPGPVVILAGSTERPSEAQMKRFLPLLRNSFRDFAGTIISGGTRAGIAGLAGALVRCYPDRLRLLTYLPEHLPRGVELHPDYSQVFRTPGDRFTPAQPLQGWIDLVGSGVNPASVRVIGIGGGRIAAAEYRIALALRARVAVLRDSGRAADELIVDPDWQESKLRAEIPADAATIRAFLAPAAAPLSPAQVREGIARAIHEQYRTDQAQRRRSPEPAMAEWPKLAEMFKQSNREQADDIPAKLAAIGCTVHGVRGRKPRLLRLRPQEVERLAENEHSRWNVERALAGWRWGRKKDMAKKLSPYLVPWSALPDDIKELDRQTVRRIPEYLALAGLEVIRPRRKAR